MNVEEALQVLKPQSASLEALKQAYRQAALKYHPDINPHGEELMKVINAAYALLQEKVGMWSHYQEAAEPGLSLDEEMQAILQTIGHLPGLQFEVCGTWLWVSGNTYQHRKLLKESGLNFAPKKKRWFWRPADSKSHGRGQWTMDEIRERHGSCSVPKPDVHAVSA